MTENRTILLVDDDPEELATLGGYFERSGWQVQRAAEAKGAVSQYERDRPDLVLLDMGQPGARGLRSLKVLRTRDADATVIMLTGHAQVATAVEAMRQGAENYLTRPVELAHLDVVSERAYEKSVLRRRNRDLAQRQSEPDDAVEAELSLEQIERRHIALVLAHHSGNRSRTARTLGISRATLYDKLARYNLDQVGRARSPARQRH